MVADGEQGDPPAPCLYERQVAPDGRRAYANGIALEIRRAVDRRVEHIERHCEAMLADARKDREALEASHRQAFAALPALREQLLDARATELSGAMFPEPFGQFGFPSAVALGLAEPVKQSIGSNARIDFAQSRPPAPIPALQDARISASHRSVKA